MKHEKHAIIEWHADRINVIRPDGSGVALRRDAEMHEIYAAAMNGTGRLPVLEHHVFEGAPVLNNRFWHA